uniref:protein-serine/threonine phosphatase n=1 Tax=Elaeophora elaphi TaxID=1147741 RepID=A0A0R3RW95_9BILA
MVRRCETKLTQARLETYVAVLICCINNNIPIQKRFSATEIVEVCLFVCFSCRTKYLFRVTDLFLMEPILIESEITEDNLTVVGNLRGIIHSLLRVFGDFGLPSMKRCLFLGGYVGCGKQQIEIIILLILMKLRWPDDLILLRNNHETIEGINTEVVPSISHQLTFAEVCQSQFPSEPNISLSVLQWWYSQWMTCLDNIRNIPRPIYARKMKFLEACLVADILHAQPNTTMEKTFEPSNSGYVNSVSLLSPQQIHMLALVSSTLDLLCNQKAHAVEEVYLPQNHVDTIMVTCSRVMRKLKRSFEAKFTERSRSELCNCCSSRARGHPTKGGTFRILIKDDNDDEHQQFMKIIYPDSHHLFDPEPFSTYDSRILDIDMTESNELFMREERRITHVQRIRALWHHLFCCFRNYRVVSSVCDWLVGCLLVAACSLSHFNSTSEHNRSYTIANCRWLHVRTTAYL